MVDDTAVADVPTSRRHWVKWALLAAVVILLAAEFTLAEPYVSNAVGTLRHVDAGWVTLAVFTQVSSMMALTRVQRRMLASGGPRVSLARMASVVWAANAVSATLPAGSALSWQYNYRRLRRWGATVPAAGFTLLASGVLSTVTFAVLIVIGAAGSGLGTMLISAAVLVGLGVPAVLLWRHRAEGVTVSSMLLACGRASVVQSYRLVRRSPERALAALDKFVADLTAIRPSRRDWGVGFSLAALNWVADLGCFLACLAAVDVPKWTLGLALIAFVAGKSASSVTFLPGGLGVVDAAMVVALTAGGVPTAGATAGVVLYRMISLVLVVAIGWLAAAGSWYVDRRVVPMMLEVVDEVVEVVDDIRPVGRVLPAMAEAMSEVVSEAVEAVSDAVDAVAPALAREGAA